jgi:hypothetical protein
MDCTHTPAMAVLAKLERAFTSERRVVAFGSAAARLMWAYATQVEVLRRLRKAASNLFAARHVNAKDGGQAVIGNVKKEDANNPWQILPTNNNLLCVECRGLSELPQEHAH